MKELNTDILIVGGGTGGCAAAMAAASMGKRVIMTDENAWIGGQLTSQAVPPDEHPWIAQFGCTARYRRYREEVLDYYRRYYPLKAEVLKQRHFNPGGGYVSAICHEFKVGHAVLNAMLAADESAGRVRILRHTKAVSADVDGDRVRAVTVRNLQSGSELTISADYVLDATELGDLLPMTGTEYVSGAESQSETGELHAVDGPAQPDNVQAISWCFAMGYDPTPGASHVIEKPEQYEYWRDYDPRLTPPWPGKLLSWMQTNPFTRKDSKQNLLQGVRSQFNFRKIIDSSLYGEGHVPNEISLLNWPQIDYLDGNIIDKPEDEVARYLEGARQLSLSFFYWMQTEAPRADGSGNGYPGLYLDPSSTGTEDGLAMYPYIRESRRIRAEFTILEEHVGTEQRAPTTVSESFHDSVGVGSYRIDLHPSTGRNNYIDVSSLPFEIPLGALIPQRMKNLIPACKNIGTTHITNGCYRLHPVEWNIGESAGALAAYCLTHDQQPSGVRSDPAHLEAFQKLLDAQGVERKWPALRPL